MRIEAKQRIDRVLGWWLLVPLRPLVVLAGKLLRRDHGGVPRGEIVVLKMLGGGNMLLGMPALLGLKRRHPGLPLTLVCGPSVAPFGALIGVFDSIQVIDDRAGLLPLLGNGARVLASLIRGRVDTVLDLEVHSVLSTVFSLLTGARNRIGFYLDHVYWRRNVHTHLVFFNRAAGVFHFYDTVARVLDATPASVEACREHLEARLAAGPSGPAAATLEALAGAPFVAVGAGCSDFAYVRLMPPDEWRAFAAREAGRLGAAHWVFLGSEADFPVAERIASVVAEAGGGLRYTNLCGRLSLEDSIRVLARARRFVGIDSALLHAARLLGIPAISFWGPTDPATLLRPIAGLDEQIHYRPPVCSPCLHVAESPPCKGDNVCMLLFTRSETPQVTWCEDATGAVTPVVAGAVDRHGAGPARPA